MSDNPIGVIKPSDLPAPPQAALRIMRACTDEQGDVQELARLAASDPVLTAELLRVVNSPYFGLGREIGNVARAMTVLGRRALRNLVLCLAVRDALAQEEIPGFDVTLYWEDALRRAAAARLLAAAAKLNQEEAFTAGLLQDFGLLVMFHVRRDLGALAAELRGQDPEARYRAEAARFAVTHDRVVDMLARAWSLPDELTLVLAMHHTSDAAPAEIAPMCRVLRGADWMAAVYSAESKPQVLARCRALLHEDFGLERAAADDLLAAVPGQVEEAAAALGLRVEEQPDFEAILRQANLSLAEANLSYQELNWRLTKTLEERDRLAAALSRELELARQIQQSLLPSRDAGLPVIGINRPARELSGDFFDYFALADGRIYFNLADVSGKGITAALLMAKASSLFHCLGKQIHNPGQLLAEINAELCETSVQGMFVTMVAGLYDPADGTVRLINAGHPPALLVGGDGEVSAFPAEAPPLGVVSPCVYPEARVALGRGSLYLFSDGVTEARLANGGMLGVSGLRALIADFAAQPAARRLESIVERVVAAEPARRDDITVLLLEAGDDGR